MSGVRVGKEGGKLSVCSEGLCVEGRKSIRVSHQN